MSAQVPPYASGPYPPYQEHPSKGANPLRHTSDRIEAWFLRFLILVLAVGLPLVSVSAGPTAYESERRAVHAQSAERHQVSARLTADPEETPDGVVDAKQRAQVHWTEKDGKQRTGTARVPPGTTAGLVGGLTAVAAGAGALAVRRCMSLVLDRRRYAQWDSDWDWVEHLWSARFRG
ncbi:hypothetical protein [Streptomyces sp. NPDC056227]|uniref:Rv1733c family protein n=1 Tax=Streptomyces sp. NPDC056227 TaxID=3345753 RepID=UPI0035E00434